MRSSSSRRRTSRRRRGRGRNRRNRRDAHTYTLLLYHRPSPPTASQEELQPLGILHRCTSPQNQTSSPCHTIPHKTAPHHSKTLTLTHATLAGLRSARVQVLFLGRTERSAATFHHYPG
ncbi:hypothetical protein O3P69_002427 [Scylla paramamosain]|uniref:Uncharacterized protein n=1 Tax=Scylla paramamosain TaxID=85552 RepID=A0AAW0V6B6_SCYPA